MLENHNSYSSHAILLFPQPDPLIRESRDRDKLLDIIRDEANSFETNLPSLVTLNDGSTAPFTVHTFRAIPQIAFWEIRPRFNYIRQWNADIPSPIIGAIIPISDPKFTATSDIELLHKLSDAQKRFLSILLDEISEAYKVPILVVYHKRWIDSLGVDELVGNELPLNVGVVSYTNDTLSGLPADIINFFKLNIAD